jgi:ABC-type Fe3+/spermidine/putrescine transport system ATPase subunit
VRQPRAPLLRLARICKSFGDFKTIDDLNLTVQQGEVLALPGPSGCGKLTTLRQIAGLDQPDFGVISLRDKLLLSSDTGGCSPWRKRKSLSEDQAVKIQVPQKALSLWPL